MNLNPKQKKAIEDKGCDPSSIQPLSGGHMSYHHFIFDGSDGSYFVKAHDPALFTDPDHEKNTGQHLKKEGAYYEHLKKSGFKHLPSHVSHDDAILLLRALHEKDGWHWRMPSDLALQESYLQDILKSLKRLETTPVYVYDPSEKSAMSIFIKDGWGSIKPNEAKQLVENGRNKWAKVLRNDTIEESSKFMDEVSAIQQLPKKKSNKIAHNHHDARQSNIAWHPIHGAVIVDWGWAGEGVENGDTTMFLIDLHKRGFQLPEDTSRFFNRDYALMMMGYWLKRSAAEPRHKNDTVRYHQFVSAVKAHDLIKRFDSLS